ncbi:MAG: c-type cytochrome [Pseudomonadota bacterium]
MKKILTATVVPVVMLLAGAQAHADALELAKKSGCMACHAVDKKVVGPSWNDVSDKYKGDATAKDTLVASITNGSRGKWGNVPMPAQKRVTAEEAATLADFIISLKK